jgi:hypothetical protein
MLTAIRRLENDSDGNYQLLSNPRVDVLRRYASSFGSLPQDVKTDKDS